MKLNALSPEWLVVEKWATTRIEKLRGQLEGRIEQRDADEVRGRIASLRELMRLPQEEDQ